MKVLQGKQKVARYRGNNDLSIDFNDLFKFKGHRKIRNSIDKQLGRIFFLISIFLIISPIFTYDGEYEVREITNSLALILPFFSILTILYGFYLNRNKTEFNINLDNHDLRKMKAEVEKKSSSNIEIENFYTEDILEIIDKGYFSHNSNFLLFLSLELLKNNKIRRLLGHRLGLNINKFKTDLENNLTKHSFDEIYKDFFLKNFETGLFLDSAHIDRSVVLLMLCKNYWNPILKKNDVLDSEIESFGEWLKVTIKKKNYYKKWKRLSRLKPIGAINRSYTSRSTRLLDQNTIDLTSDAALGNFKLTIGKEEFISEIITKLANNQPKAILISAKPGVGKSYILQDIATKMAVEDVAKQIQDYRLVNLDLTLAYSKNQADFLRNFQKMLVEINRAGNIILAIDDIDQLFDFDQITSKEIINLLISHVENYGLKLVATANIEDKDKIVSDKSFFKIFDEINIPEPNENILTQILIDEAEIMQREYEIAIDIKAIKEISKFSPKLSYEKAEPSKGIGMLEEAFQLAQRKNLKFIDVHIIDEILKKHTGVDIGQLDSDDKYYLENLENELKKSIIGQKHAVSAVVSAIKRKKSGVENANNPISFMFYGPTGVGKTQLAKSLANAYFGHENRMLRFDMSEYHENENIGRLIGTTNNGNFEDGVLTSQIKQNPFSLILFDELEKANPKVLDLFLQILDEGKIKDGKGNIINFQESVIIATSNVGSRKIAELLNRKYDYVKINKEIEQEMQTVFRVEFLNRFDKLIMFKPLELGEIEKIVDLKLKELDTRLIEKGIKINWDIETVKELAELSYNKVYGAREVDRIMDEYIEDPISESIINNALKSGSQITFTGLKIKNIK